MKCLDWSPSENKLNLFSIGDAAVVISGLCHFRSSNSYSERRKRDKRFTELRLTTRKQVVRQSEAFSDLSSATGQSNAWLVAYAMPAACSASILDFLSDAIGSSVG